METFSFFGDNYMRPRHLTEILTELTEKNGASLGKIGQMTDTKL